MHTTRRRFLRNAAQSASALSLAAGCEGLTKSDAPMPYWHVDCHAHLYDPTRPQGVPWPPKEAKWLYRPVLPNDFLRVAAPHGIHHTVVVEASPWVEDNQWLLDLAKDEPAIVGVVGHLVPGTDAFAGHLRRFAKNPIFKGIRLHLEGKGVPKKPIDDPRVMRDLVLMADLGLELDVLTWAVPLPQITRLAGDLPDLRIVINHIAGVRVDGKPPPPETLRELRAVAGRPNVWCKVSALTAMTGSQNGDAPTDTGFYEPTLDAFWEAFGEDKLIYGSDWPVCERASPYSLVYRIVDEYFRDKGPVPRAKYFSINGRAAYRWGEGRT